MDNGPIPGEVPSGATMQPRYMMRTLDTYPVSDSEMQTISSLGADAATKFSSATFFFTLGASIWVNATFYSEFTPIAKLAVYYVAPFLVLVSAYCAIRGVLAQRNRDSAWDEIKKGANPSGAVATQFAPTAPRTVTVVSEPGDPLQPAK